MTHCTYSVITKTRRACTGSRPRTAHGLPLCAERGFDTVDAWVEGGVFEGMIKIACRRGRPAAPSRTPSGASSLRPRTATRTGEPNAPDISLSTYARH